MFLVTNIGNKHQVTNQVTGNKRRFQSPGTRFQKEASKHKLMQDHDNWEQIVYRQT